MAYEATAHVALSWKKSPGYTSDIFFGLVDYDSRGAEIFKKVFTFVLFKIINF